MRKYIATFLPYRCEPRHLEMITKYAEMFDISESEAMRSIVEDCMKQLLTDEDIDLLDARKNSSMNHSTFLQSGILYKMPDIIGNCVDEFTVNREKFHKEFDKLFDKISTREELGLDYREKYRIEDEMKNKIEEKTIEEKTVAIIEEEEIEQTKTLEEKIDEKKEDRLKKEAEQLAFFEKREKTKSYLE